MYGGGCTTLGLVATSVHPERAGVQNALMQILIDHGARHRSSAGRRKQSFVRRGMPGQRTPPGGGPVPRRARRAAGSRRRRGHRPARCREGVISMPRAGSSRSRPRKQMAPRSDWACKYGRTASPNSCSKRAAIERPSGTMGRRPALGRHRRARGHRRTASRAPRASRTSVDERYHGTPLAWALHGWSDPPFGTPSRPILRRRRAAGSRRRDRETAVVRRRHGPHGVRQRAPRGHRDARGASRKHSLICCRASFARLEETHERSTPSDRIPVLMLAVAPSLSAARRCAWRILVDTAPPLRARSSRYARPLPHSSIRSRPKARSCS